MEASGMQSTKNTENTENTENTWRHLRLLVLPYQDIHEDISNSDVTYEVDDDGMGLFCQYAYHTSPVSGWQTHSAYRLRSGTYVPGKEI